MIIPDFGIYSFGQLVKVLSPVFGQLALVLVLGLNLNQKPTLLSLLNEAKMVHRLYLTLKK